MNEQNKENLQDEQEQLRKETNATSENSGNEPDAADEIKSRIEGDLEQLGEKPSAGEKDWAAELKSVEDKYLRLYAEFDNYKRRTAAERIELFKTANQELLVALLPVLDDFERALKAMQTAKEVDAVKEGIELVSSKLKNILTGKGLKAMESIGKDFDSDYHEAITKIPAPSDDLKGKVVDEVEKGYFLGDKVVRFAKVVIGE